MLDPTAEYILLFMAFAVVLAALTVLVRAVVGTASGCMSILLEAVELGERAGRLFSRQAAVSTQHVRNRDPQLAERRQHADVRVAKRLPANLPAKFLPATAPPSTPTLGNASLTGKGSAKTLPVIHLDKATACQQGSADCQGQLPTPSSQLPVTFEAKPTGCQEGSAAPKATTASLGRRRSARPCSPALSNLVPPRKRAVKVTLSRSAGVATQRMSTVEIAIVAAAFRRWIGDWRMIGRRIAVDDVWAEAQNFARAKGIPLPKRDRFLEVLSRTPGVLREYDVRLDGKPKTTVYEFSMPTHGADEFIKQLDSTGPTPNSR